MLHLRRLTTPDPMDRCDYCLRLAFAARDGRPGMASFLYIETDSTPSLFFASMGRGESRLDNGCARCERVGDDLPSKIGARRTTLVRRVYRPLRLLRTAATVLLISA